MSYCLNPCCRHPENPTSNERCQSCSLPLLKLRDRYRVTKALAQGGFGATFLAKDDGLPGEPVCVIKQLRIPTNTPEVLPMARELFAREAKTLGKIGNHPQIPRLLDYFEIGGQFYLVQEFINGCTIGQEIKRNGPISEAGVRQFLSEILVILKYLHEQQVIHRDIKPNNLIRRVEDGRLVLIDFGAVKDQVTQSLGSHTEQTTLTAFAIGTAGFAPPEQIAMRPVYASDIYAVGITCLYLLTGKAPKDFGYNPLTGDMLWEREVDLGQHMTGVIKKMLEASVRHRYQSASEVLKALELEPYFDTNTKGMAQPDRNPPQAKPDSHAASSVAATAAAIRARRGKDAETGNLNAMLTRQQSGTGMPATGIPKVGTPKVGAPKTLVPSTAKSKEPSRLDANSLVAAYLGGKRDFVEKNLSLLDLQRKNLSGVNFHASKLDRTNLQGANLCNTDFGQASLSGANLRDANLTNAYLSHTDLSGADLRGADLSDAYLSNTNLRGANLCGAKLIGAKVTDEQLALAKTNWMTIRPNGRRG